MFMNKITENQSLGMHNLKIVDTIRVLVFGHHVFNGGNQAIDTAFVFGDFGIVTLGLGQYHPTQLFVLGNIPSMEPLHGIHVFADVVAGLVCSATDAVATRHFILLMGN